MIDYEKERAAFEAVFPMPNYGIHWNCNDYYVTEYNAWSANDYVQKWKGWIARAKAV